ncbi:hypothetical protein RHGRI_000878 [Rhododendron griersonianum]|uniref:Uncharacterized protein n=1 Tax=Rhododendron griersonianum TaxID=479676 RepID=A0AAV6LJD8_9ERIC|nr:hypothetical protein RHGRI_000878 [Rhododendron griersonianum]
MASIAAGISKVLEALVGSGKGSRNKWDELPVESVAASVEIDKKLLQKYFMKHPHENLAVFADKVWHVKCGHFFCHSYPHLLAVCNLQKGLWTSSYNWLLFQTENKYNPCMFMEMLFEDDRVSSKLISANFILWAIIGVKTLSTDSIALSKGMPVKEVIISFFILMEQSKATRQLCLNSCLFIVFLFFVLFV